MRRIHPLLLLLCAAVVMLNGCERIKEERKHQLLESATSGYRQALRWGYYDAAIQFIKPEERPEAPSERLKNIRVTGYEVVQPPVMTEADQAVQMVRIEYVLRDRQRLESLAERQHWQYDQEASAWWLTTGLPTFTTDR
ncbi:hypothetical protein [Rhabdochromatium marinum]|uniref:hypothetical protein n=1 Tax=Rhabdochromatium marinum TaxID=48729 RepID=UPI001907DDD2|nr:hypothetical protein [Rhabdochromatium marinum]MBK1647798.1 hypothetical protein [Rhabdochromatium marinum]